MLSSGTALGLVTSAAGVGILRFAWRRAGSISGAMVALGWIVLLVSAGFFISQWGAEFGTSFALASFTLCAIFIVSLNTQRRPEQSPAQSANNDRSQNNRVNKWLTFVAAGPLACIASAQTSLLFSRLLPVTPMNQMMWAVIVFPCLWGALAFASSASKQPGKHALLYLLAAALASSGLVFIAKAAT